MYLDNFLFWIITYCLQGIIKNKIINKLIAIESLVGEIVPHFWNEATEATRLLRLLSEATKWGYNVPW